MRIVQNTVARDIIYNILSTMQSLICTNHTINKIIQPRNQDFGFTDRSPSGVIVQLVVEFRVFSTDWKSSFVVPTRQINNAPMSSQCSKIYITLNRHWDVIDFVCTTSSNLRYSDLRPTKLFLRSYTTIGTSGGPLLLFTS